MTRDEFYARLRERLPGAPARAHAVRSRGAAAPLGARGARGRRRAAVQPAARPVGEILALYDELRRRHKTVADFDRLDDRHAGAERASTIAAPRGCWRRRASWPRRSRRSSRRWPRSTGVDEHGVRALALGVAAAALSPRSIVTVADQAADRRGLWTADFDLLGADAGPRGDRRRRDRRRSSTPAFTSGCTRACCPASRTSRLRGARRRRRPSWSCPTPRPAPSCSAPFVCRDREEELAEFARALKTAPRATPLGRTAIVFQRPLPYLYLARQVFGDARLPYQALDSLPLAAEPFAAAVDLVFSAIAAGLHPRRAGRAAALVRTSRSSADGRALDARGRARARSLSGRAEIPRRASRSAALAALGGRVPARGARGRGRRRRELHAAAATRRRRRRRSTASSRSSPRASGCRRPPTRGYARHLRARGGRARRRCRCCATRTRRTIRRRCRSRSCPARCGGGSKGRRSRRASARRGVMLLDATRRALRRRRRDAASSASSEADWPERSGRSIFYPQSLLAQLGWPGEQDRFAAARARFQDLLRLPRRRVSLSTFTLEDDAIVSPSPLLEEVDGGGLPVERLVAARRAAPPRVFVHEALAIDPVAPARRRRRRGATGWRCARRAASTTPRFRGSTGARAPATYAVSRLERYLECPFKYFAAHVLQAAGGARRAGVDDAAGARPLRARRVRELLRRVAAARPRRDHDGQRRRGDGAVRRGRRAAPRGAARRGSRARADAAARIGGGGRLRRARLRLRDRGRRRRWSSGCSSTSSRHVHVRRRTADRGRSRCARRRIASICSQDGTLRVVDYKIGRAPERKRSLQLPIYGVCAQQALDGRARAVVDGLARRLHRVQGEDARSASCRIRRRRWPKGRRRLLTVVDGDRARRVPGPARRAVPLQLVPVSRRLPQGLRRRRDREMTRPAVAVRDRGSIGIDAGDPASTPRSDDPDAEAREFARDPDHNVVLEASAGTGKTSVLVTRYVNLLTRGVDPANILAITFTRKAAAEMRERIIRELRRAGRAVDVRSRALDRDPRSPRRHPDQHHRRVLPVAAARVPARGGSRSRLRDGRRDRSAAARRSVARQVAGDLHRPGEARAGPGAGARAARADAHARGAGVPAAAAARRLGRARPVPRARPGGSRRRRRLPARGRRADRSASRRAPAGSRRSSPKGRCTSRATSCSRRISRRLESFRTAGNAAVRGLMNRVAAHLLKADGKPRDAAIASIPTRTSDYPSRGRRGKRHRQEAHGSARRSRTSLRALQPRPQRRARARHPQDVRDRAGAVPEGAQRAVAARFLRRAAARRRAARRGWTSSRRAATASRGATTTCSSTSSRTPAASSGSSSRCW